MMRSSWELAWYTVIINASAAEGRYVRRQLTYRPRPPSPPSPSACQPLLFCVPPTRPICLLPHCRVSLYYPHCGISLSSAHLYNQSTGESRECGRLGYVVGVLVSSVVCRGVSHTGPLACILG